MKPLDFDPDPRTVDRVRDDIDLHKRKRHGGMTAAEEAKLREVIKGCDTALMWLDAEVRRLQAALDAGVSLEVIGALNRIAMRSRG